MNNKLKVGLGLLTVLATPIVTNEVASNNAQAAQGWVKNGNVWQFYNQNGTPVKNKWIEKLLVRCRWKDGNKCLGR